MQIKEYSTSRVLAEVKISLPPKGVFFVVPQSHANLYSPALRVQVRLVQFIKFDERNALSVVLAAHYRGVVAGVESNGEGALA